MNSSLIESVKTCFKAKFSDVPLMVISPGRINLIGEHTDYNDGFVFPAAIDKGIIAAFSETDTDHCRAYAYDKDETYEFSLDSLKPIDNGGWRNYVVGVVAEIENKHRKVRSFNVVFGGDIPEGAGLSSSAALENSIVYGLNELFDLKLTKSEMILISQQAEHNFAGVRCGIMDQYASMFGEEEHALLLDCRTQEAIPYKIDFKNYQLILINTNVSHNLAEAAYNDRRMVCEKIAALLQIKALRDATEEKLKRIKPKLSEEDYQKGLYVIQENKRVISAAQFIKDDDIKGFGELLYKAHDGARDQFKISCEELDFLVDLAKSNPNVAGARMMGGGFGGCTINIIKSNEVESFIDEVSKRYRTQFGSECSIYFVTLSNGTRVLNQRKQNHE